MNIKYISFLVVSVLLIMAACKNEPKAASTTTDPAAATSTQPTPVSAPANVTAPPNFTPTTAPAAEPAQNAKGVWHFTCPKGCAGGAGVAGPCGKCGEQLVHNTAYHQ
jgi:uncharacterized lipoprotein